MSDDWQPGDVALCVSNRPGNSESAILRRGREYIVSGVMFDNIATSYIYGDEPHLSLRLIGAPNIYEPTAEDDGWCASRFIKQPPQITKEEAAREEMINSPVREKAAAQ